ncbi:MAG TPA: ABC transporter permease [Blastocatellia bacterium]|nr:ABC transporter permease [Blastocatellia bacterium]
MQTLWQDLRYGARTLGKTPGLTIIALLSMAIGIGANTAIFSLVDKLLLQTMPVEEPERLALLSSESVNPRFKMNVFSWPDYKDYRERNQVFSDLIASGPRLAGLGTGAEIEQVACELVSENYFSALGVRLIKGRSFTAEDNSAPGASAVAILGHGLWRRRFGANPEIIGQTIGLNGANFTVVGVAPPGFKGIFTDRPSEIWAPVMMYEPLMQLNPGNNRHNRRSSGWLKLMGRMKPGVTLAQAQSAMDTLARQIREANTPVSNRALPFYEKRIFADPGARGDSFLRAKVAAPLQFLMTTVGLILLIACANVANLSLARSATRRREIAVRLALGASRGRIVAQLLTESALLAFIGGALGLILAPWLNDLLLAFQPEARDMQAWLSQTLDARVLVFTLTVSALSGLLFGLLPALQASKPGLVSALKDDGALHRGRERFWSLRHLLVVGQVALSLVVLIGAGLCVRSLGKLFAIDPGFNPENALVMDVDLPASAYDEPKGRELFHQLRERLQALPGVEGVTMANLTPLSGSRATSSFLVEGMPMKQGEMLTSNYSSVGPGYHELMRISLKAGRGFSEMDRDTAPGVAIINEAFAKAYFPNQNPIGKRISLGANAPWLEIIGLAHDTKNLFLTETPSPYFYLPTLQRPFDHYQRVIIRTRTDANALRSAARDAAASLDPNLALANITTLDNELRDSIASSRMATALTTLFGATALLLAGIGLYGVISYSVSRRTREIGIRMALGAQTRDALWMVTRQGMTLALVGSGIGLIASLALTRLIETLLFDVSPIDPVTFIAVPLLLVGVTLGACYIPARRAAKVDPMVALRSE